MKFYSKELRAINCKAQLIASNRQRGITISDESADVIVEFQMRLEDALNLEFKGTPPNEETPIKVREIMGDTFKAMVQEARRAGNWKKYGLLFALLGNHGFDPEKFL